LRGSLAAEGIRSLQLRYAIPRRESLSCAEHPALRQPRSRYHATHAAARGLFHAYA
jgi:hypothetical protein